uniref:BHLH domain-containing protein n=1 Tax=Knipowitschia caucasica TaxID=637954 RepID=A0AAV2J8H7_KNICA
MASRDQVARLDSSDSDSEPDRGGAVRAGCSGPSVCWPHAQVIHSGHFMVSSPHRDSAVSRRRSAERYDFDTVTGRWCQTYHYGPLSRASLSIDPTLTRLFECMSLAYSGKIVSPKWKSFKGLRLLWRDKIRLNNAIWRAWFIQCKTTHDVEKRKNPVCGFVSPLEGSEAEAHRKPEAIVLEGSYWKRRIEVVIKEYHKWRIYYKKRLQKKKNDIFSMFHEGQICHGKLEKWTYPLYQEPEVAPAEAHMFDLDCLLSDISDTLFTMTQKPCPWTSDRHSGYTSNADIIQPGLTPLQPNLDDFMDIQDIFMNYRGQTSEQTSYTDCGYFESSPGAVFASAPSPVVTTPQLLIDTQMPQPSLSSDSRPQPSSSNSRPELSRSSQDCSEYPTPGIVSGAIPYLLQTYPDPSVSVALTTAIEEPSTTSVPMLYPLSCHKFGYYSPSSMTSTVITHIGSSMGPLGLMPQPHSYSHTGDAYSQNACHSLGYPAGAADPLHAALPSVTVPHCFSVPEQSLTGGRGKHKQKTGGATGPMSAANTPTSCLAKLLSSGSQERKPSLGFDSLIPTKGQRTSPPSSTLQCDGAWHTGIPVLTPPHNQTASLDQGMVHAGTSRGNPVPPLLTHNTTHTSTTLLIPKTEKLSPVLVYGSDQSCLTDQLLPNPLDKFSNPESPQPTFPGLGKQDSSKHTESRRITHISAEQKRRFNIRLGFDTLHNLVTTLNSQPSIKISKATTLQKTAEYISKMQQDRTQLHEEAQRLREEIQLLNSSINACQQQLPATGVPITRQRFDHMRQKFREYVRTQTLQNWKFWIFSIIIEPLFESYNGMVSTASVEDLCRSTLSWLDQHCSLPALRPMILSSLRLLSTTTAILTDPSLLPEQATIAVTQGPTAALDHSLQPAPQ